MTNVLMTNENPGNSLVIGHLGLGHLVILSMNAST
jgi:hypothetical protein